MEATRTHYHGVCNVLIQSSAKSSQNSIQQGKGKGEGFGGITQYIYNRGRFAEMLQPGKSLQLLAGGIIILKSTKARLLCPN